MASAAQTPDNPQAFPCLDSSGYGLSMRDPGMSLRDWFAGQALAGLCANAELLKQMPATLKLSKRFADDALEAAYADLAHKHADAMLAERGK